MSSLSVTVKVLRNVWSASKKGSVPRNGPVLKTLLKAGHRTVLLEKVGKSYYGAVSEFAI